MEQILEFVNLETVAERLKGKKMISLDFLNIENIWLRAAFIPVDKDSNGVAESVIYTTQYIDDYKRREQELILNSYTDELTSFLNRRAYEDRAREFAQKGIPSNMVLISFDLNGLKVVNDTQGHAVGDELLLGAASCMKSCVGAYGDLYRVGGDEFMAIIMANDDKLKEILADFEETVSLWSNEHIDHLSVSVGAVASRDFSSASFDELEEIADNRMYKSKALFYKRQSTRK